MDIFGIFINDRRIGVIPLWYGGDGRRAFEAVRRPYGTSS